MMKEQQEEEMPTKERRHQHGPKKQKPNRQTRQPMMSDEDDDIHYINSSRGGHGAPLVTDSVPMESPRESGMSNQDRPGAANNHAHADSVPASSLGSSRDGPPKVYEELI